MTPATGVEKPSRALLWLVAVGVFMQMLDSTIVNTALPSMAAGLHESPLRMQSVVIAYALTMAMLIPASGWLADRFGTRRIFFTAIVLFTFGSLLCASSRTLPSWSARASCRVSAARCCCRSDGFRCCVRPARRFPARDELRHAARSDRSADRPDARRLAGAGRLLALDIPDQPAGRRARCGSDLALHAGCAQQGGALRSWRLPHAVRQHDRHLAVADGLSELGLHHASVLLLQIFGMASFVAYWLHATRVKNPLFSLALFGVHTFRVGVLGNLFSRIGSGSMPFLIPLLLQVSLGLQPVRCRPDDDSGRAGRDGVQARRGAAGEGVRLSPRAARQYAAGRACDGELRADLARTADVAAHRQLAFFGMVNSLQSPR